MEEIHLRIAQTPEEAVEMVKRAVVAASVASDQPLQRMADEGAPVVVSLVQALVHYPDLYAILKGPLLSWPDIADDWYMKMSE